MSNTTKRLFARPFGLSGAQLGHKPCLAEINQSYAEIVAQAEARLRANPDLGSPPTITIPQLKLERLTIQGQITMADLAQTYLTQRSQELKPGSFKSIRFSLGLLTSLFGSKRIGDLSLSNVQEFLALLSCLNPDVTKSTARKVILRHMIVNRELIKQRALRLLLRS
ncbi:hypothetical protein [Falsihalocynthiibacter arcticus]|uniref:Core-binding (CB) domain-containing protein n=1 Tax=Falsihalocynthiibacter arcticus TaxID=1579316 RepID=A0A126V4U9_9RHOB|nr:hypothetical protein [Falsihalocynthiibacter arcticus]AML52995.1 hypothetical protein RC74_18585 [Falsihalocynthiibacter arcticus]